MKRFIILTLVLGLICWGATVFAMGNKGPEKKEAAQTQGSTSAQGLGIQFQDVEKWKGKEVKALNDENLGASRTLSRTAKARANLPLFP